MPETIRSHLGAVPVPEVGGAANEIRFAKARYRRGMSSSPSGLLVANDEICRRHETGLIERLDIRFADR